MLKGAVEGRAVFEYTAKHFLVKLAKIVKKEGVYLNFYIEPKRANHRCFCYGSSANHLRNIVCSVHHLYICKFYLNILIYIFFSFIHEDHLININLPVVSVTIISIGYVLTGIATH